MKCWLFMLALFLCGTARAQDTREYLFFAPGATTDGAGTVHAYGGGAGLELLLGSHFGVGPELAGFVPGQGKVSNGVVGIFSTNAYYHLGRDQAFDPFATVGYSLVFRDFTANGGNFGAGMNYWFRQNLGLLFEGRDHVAPVRGTTTHFWEIRIGLAFR
jgi:hypothetical protein